MKKSFFLASLALLSGIMLTGCKEDTYPRVENPSGEFKLYEPANNNFTYDLTDNSNAIILTTSGQPDYGVATTVKYQAEVSLDNEWKDAVVDPSGEVITPATYYRCAEVTTQSVVVVPASQVNEAITVLQGITEPEQADLYDPSIRPIYVRVLAYISNPAAESGYLAGSQYYTNSVKINSVQPSLEAYLPQPAVLWAIGDYQGWDINGNDKTITVTEEENGIGSDIYTGYIHWDTGAVAKTPFRFYKALGDWETNSIGSQVDDQPITVDMSGEGASMSYTGSCVNGKGSWQISNFPAEGGWMKITVNLKSMQVTFENAPDYQP